MRNYNIVMYPSIMGKKKKVVQTAKGSNRRNARKSAKENLHEEYGSDLW
ncbi:MAG TPA: hypothetical protein VMY59_08045 [Candidatus Thermoplasmatota archaeon]|nr:hypothetical protein [Candidatus Thermoplasmatota archaeon]